MKYQSQGADRRSRWSLVKDAVDLDMLLAVTDMEPSRSLDPLLSESTQSLNRNSAYKPPRPAHHHLIESSPSLYSAASFQTSTTSLETDHGDYDYVVRRGSGDSYGEERLYRRDSDANIGDEDNVNCPSNCRVCTGIAPSLPKSMSLPLRQVTPDPFPELTTSPITPSSAQIHLDVSTRSSPNSPIATRGHRCSKALASSLPGSKSGSAESLERAPTPENMMWTPQAYTKMLMNFYNEDTSWKTVSLSETMTACEVCQHLIEKNHTSQDKNWVIVEHIAKFNLERSLEDHEVVQNVQKAWGSCEDNRFYFRKDFRKYEVFKNPNQFFPQSMVETKITDDEDSLQSRTERYKNLLLQNLFHGDKLPDIQGYLYMKESKRSWWWKKYFFVLRASGLYYSTKGNSKDPQHLVLFSALNDVDVYTVGNAKKAFSSPKNFCLCLKPKHNVTDAKELKLVCAEDEQSRTCWLTGLRLVKYGSQLRENYKAALRHEGKQQMIESDAQKDPLSVKSRVAMDFTGTGGRVVEDPNEALGVALEEAHNWRKKVSSRLTPNNHSPVSGSPKVPGSFLSENPCVARSGISSGLHMTQPWFHSGISREEAVGLISKQGLVDGVFLVRESHSLPGAFVLSLAHNHKVKHCQILQIEKDGHLMFSLDGGHTKFADLLQLVEFYQLNAGGLPTTLSYYVTRLA